MLNNIKISQTTNEIILNVNVIADINEILEELQAKLPKLRDFYQTSTIPMRVTGRLFTENEIKKVKATINSEIPVEIKFDDEKIAWYEFSELDQIEHSYAITIHKAQRK